MFLLREIACGLEKVTQQLNPSPHINAGQPEVKTYRL